MTRLTLVTLVGVVAVATSVSPACGGLVEYWSFDNSANVGLDSINGTVLSAAGGAAYTAAGHTGGGLALNAATSDYLFYSPTNAVPTGVPTGNDSYTISAWIKPTAGGRNAIAGWGNYGTGRQVNAFRLGDGASNLTNYWWGADLNSVSTAPVNLYDGNWHHVVATYNGKVRALWVDGTRIGFDTPGANNAQPANFRIGSTNSAEFFGGTMDDVAIYSNGLTANQIQALAAGAAPTGLPLPTPVDHFRADDLNSQANGFTLTNGAWTSAVGTAAANVAGGTPTLRKDAIGSHSVVNFDSGTDVLQVVGGAMTTSAGGDFSIVAVYRTNQGAGGVEAQPASGWWANTSIVDSEQAGRTNDWGLAINSTGHLAAGLGTTSSSDVTTVYSSGGGYMKDGLAHVAVYTRTGTTATLFVDGAQVGTGTVGSAALRNAVDYFLGGNHTGGNRLTGDIAEARVYDVALSAAEVATLSTDLRSTYASSLYQGAVLASGPTHYYRLGEGTTTAARAYDEVGVNHGTYTNGPAVSQPGGLKKDGNTAVVFDGVNDFVRVPNDLPASFTLEVVLKTSANSLTGAQAYSGNGVIWSDVAGVADDFVLAVLNNHLAFFDGDAAGGAGATIEGTTLVNDGNWHHVAVTRVSGGPLRIYLDGYLEASGTAGVAALTSNPNIDIGGNTLDGRYFNGSLDEVAFYGRALTAGEVFAHFAAATVPEPSTFLLGFLGLAALALLRGRRPRYTTS